VQWCRSETFLDWLNSNKDTKRDTEITGMAGERFAGKVVRPILDAGDLRCSKKGLCLRGIPQLGVTARNGSFSTLVRREIDKE
jgi:hypothetical protein